MFMFKNFKLKKQFITFLIAGGLAASVEQSSGELPSLWFCDNSRRERPRLHPLEKEIDKVMRSRVLNPKWIDNIKKHGYKGAFEISATVDYLFAFNASTGITNNWYYSQIIKQFLLDNSTNNFLRNNNPWALRDIAERLLEASNRGIWSNAIISEIDILKQIIYETELEIEKS